MADAEVALSSLISNVKPGDLDSFLASISKYEKLLDKGIAIVEKLDRMGILPAAIRAFGAKQGIQDIDKPLSDPLSVTAVTSSHKLLFQTLNKAPEEQVVAMFKAASQANAQSDVVEAEVVEDDAEEQA